MIERLETETDMLNRHYTVLEQVTENQPIGIVNLSDELGYPKHKIRYSLRVLEEESIIEPTSQGAVTTDQAAAFFDEYTERLEDVVDQLGSLSDPASTSDGGPDRRDR